MAGSKRNSRRRSKQYWLGKLAGLSDKPTLLTSFGSAVKEILTHVPNSLIILNLFPDRWKQFQQFFDGSVVDRVSQYEVHLNRPDKDKLRDILRLKAESVGLDLDQLFESAELKDILSQNSIRAVLNRAAAYYRYKASGIPLPRVTSTSSKSPLDTSIEARLHRLENEFNALKKAIAGSAVAVQPLSTFSKEAIEVSDVTVEPPYQNVEPLAFDQAKSVVSHIQVVRATDEIITDYLSQKREELERDYDARPHIVSASDDLGKLSEIVGAFQILQHSEIEQLRLGKKTLPEHLQLKIDDSTFVIGFLHVSGNSFMGRIRNFNQLVTENPKTQFRLIRDISEPQITSKVSKDEIEKLNRLQNGTFAIMDKADRIHFELTYNLIVDIVNGDLDKDLATALRLLATQLGEYWITSILLLY